MDPIWLPATLVLALGLVWATLDAWWTRRRWRLDRERRRQALPAAALATPAAVAQAPAPTPAVAPAGPVTDPAPAAAARAEAPYRTPERLPRANEAREADLPA